MINAIYKSAKSRLMSSLPSEFLRNNDGIAAIEFAFIAPVMLFMYFGMAEVATAITIDRQVSHSANVAGDLTTQSETVSADEMSEIMTATMLVMGIPASQHGNVTIEIASYSRDADDNVVPMGSAVLNGPFPVTFDASELDARILSNTSGVVVARVNYNYEPLKLRYMPSNFDLREIFMLKPRKSANVEILDPGGSSNYTCSFSAGKPSCLTGGTTS